MRSHQVHPTRKPSKLLEPRAKAVFCPIRRERKIYFEKLDVAAIQCNLTLIPRPGQRAEVDPVCLVCCPHCDTAPRRPIASSVYS